MTYNKFYFRILLYILAILLFSLLSVWAFYTDYLKLAKIGFPIALAWFSFSLFRFICTSFERINNYLKLSLQEESKLHFKTNSEQPLFVELEDLLNSIHDENHKYKLQREWNTNFYKSIIEQIESGVLVFDKQGKTAVANRALCRLLNKESINHLDEIESIQKGLSQRFRDLKAGETIIQDYQATDAKLRLAISAYEIRMKENSYKVVFLTDISKELDKEELENWQKLLRIIRHEIINSITPIQTLSETLLDVIQGGALKSLKQSDLSGEYKTLDKCMQAIHSRSLNLEKFVNSYKEYSSLPTPVYRSFVLESFLQSFQLLFKEELKEKNIQLDIELKTNKKELYSDELILSQVMMNLIRNAIQAIESEGKILLRGEETTNGFKLEVQDSGKGIAREELKHIFIPFYTSKEDGQGIGLSLSKQLITQLGGDLKVQTEEGKGSVFQIVLKEN